IDDYVPWIAKRKGEAFATRLKKKMGDNVLFALGATIQAMSGGDPREPDDRLGSIARELDDACHVYVGSGVGDLPHSYNAARCLDRATRQWNAFWADPAHCAARASWLATGKLDGPPPPIDPAPLPIDSEERRDAKNAWDEFWAARSEER